MSNDTNQYFSNPQERKKVCKTEILICHFFNVVDSAPCACYLRFNSHFDELTALRAPARPHQSYGN